MDVPSIWCEEWEERNYTYFRCTLEILTLMHFYLSSQFHDLMLNMISGYCEGGGQCKEASGIQPRQMVGKQIFDRSGQEILPSLEDRSVLFL